MKKYLAITLLSGLLLHGCFLDKEESNVVASMCDNNTSLYSTIPEIINNDAIDKIKATNENTDISKARVSLAQMKISYSGIATTKKDPNSTKVFCKAQMKIVIPTEMLKLVEQEYKKTGNSGLFRDALVGGLEASANSFIRIIDYDVQPSDDGKEIYTTLEQMGHLSDFLSTAVLLEQASKITPQKVVSVSSDNANTTESTEQQSHASNSDYLKNYAHQLMTGYDIFGQSDIKVKKNSSGVKIYCLNDMSMCKTEAEVSDYYLQNSNK